LEQQKLFSYFWFYFLNWSEIMNDKKRSLFNPTGSLRQFNGLYPSLDAIPHRNLQKIQAYFSLLFRGKKMV